MSRAVFQIGVAKIDGDEEKLASVGNAVAIGEFANLSGLINKLVAAVRAGELDDHFALAPAERGLMLRNAG